MVCLLPGRAPGYPGKRLYQELIDVLGDEEIQPAMAGDLQ